MGDRVSAWVPLGSEAVSFIYYVLNCCFILGVKMLATTGLTGAIPLARPDCLLDCFLAHGIF